MKYVIFCRVKEVMDMQKRPGVRSRRKRSKARRVMSVLACIFLPPVGIFMVWRTRWSNNARYCLTGLAVACMVLMVAMLPSPDVRVNGGVELVGRKKVAEIYGPDLPTAMVTGYVAPVNESVFVQESEDDTVYVMAVPVDKLYHLEGCRKAYATAQKMTLYETFYLEYAPCNICHPPIYQQGTM